MRGNGEDKQERMKRRKRRKRKLAVEGRMIKEKELKETAMRKSEREGKHYNVEQQRGGLKNHWQGRKTVLGKERKVVVYANKRERKETLITEKESWKHNKAEKRMRK